MKPVLALTFGYADGSFRALTAEYIRPSVVFCDIYALPDTDLHEFSALFISMHSDQRFLASHAHQIEDYLVSGGTVVASGHFAYPFLPRMIGFHTIDHYKVEDIEVMRLVDHPIWQGVAERDLTFRRGVAGFYGRVWHDAPEDALVIHTLGRNDRPLDFIYPVGRGRVLFHGGNDLWQFDSQSGHLVPQLMQWIGEGELS